MNRRELLRQVAVVLGASLSGTLSRALLAGADPARTTSAPAFDAPTRRLVASIAELILPRTDTPGAIDAGVPAFIEMMFGEWYTATERRIFSDGLAALTRHCEQQFGATFVDCDGERQTEGLRFMETLAARYEGVAASPLDNATDENTPFYTKIRELTIVGYYCSEAGATREHRYDPMPMHYDGDIALADIGRQWST